VIYAVMWALLAIAALAVVRINRRRYERWVDEQIRLDEEARRVD
jgi:hypothetical protein